jgi:hypothetical protein
MFIITIIGFITKPKKFTMFINLTMNLEDRVLISEENWTLKCKLDYWDFYFFGFSDEDDDEFFQISVFGNEDDDYED